MSKLTVHTIDTAPERAKKTLENSEKAYGFLPNLLGVLAEAPALLEGYTTLSKIFGSSSLSRAEQQVVILTASYENECHYCMAAHTRAARMADLPQKEIDALRSGTPLRDSRLQALHHFTRRMVQSRGWVEPHEVDAFVHAGYGKQQILEVILGIAVKVMSNYTNHLADTPLDQVFRANAWTKAASAETDPGKETLNGLPARRLG